MSMHESSLLRSLALAILSIVDAMFNFVKNEPLLKRLNLTGPEV